MYECHTVLTLWQNWIVWCIKSWIQEIFYHLLMTFQSILPVASCLQRQQKKKKRREEKKNQVLKPPPLPNAPPPPTLNVQDDRTVPKMLFQSEAEWKPQLKRNVLTVATFSFSFFFFFLNIGLTVCRPSQPTLPPLRQFHTHLQFGSGIFFMQILTKKKFNLCVEKTLVDHSVCWQHLIFVCNSFSNPLSLSKRSVSDHRCSGQLLAAFFFFFLS